MNTQLMQLTKQFAKELIQVVPEFQELLQAKKALDADTMALEIWQSKEDQRQTIELLKTQGLPVSPQQQAEFSSKLKAMRENPIAMRYLKAINFANKISGKIGTELLNLIGADFAPRKGCK